MNDRNRGAAEASSRGAIEQAMAFHNAGEIEKAEAAYRAVLAARPEQIEAWSGLGLLYAQMKRFAEAEQALRRAIDLQPGFARTHYRLGQVLGALGRTDEELQRYGAYIESPAPDINILLDISRACAAKDRLETAMLACEKAAFVAPDNPEPLLMLAGLHQREHRLLEPARLYERVLELRPGLQEVRRVLAFIYQLMGRLDLGVPQRERLAREAPEKADFLRELLVDMSIADVPAARMAEMRDLWRRQFEAPLKAARRPHRNSRDPQRRLKIGYVGGPQFCAHTLAVTLRPFFKQHDRTQFDLYAYSDLPEQAEDQISAEYREHSIWRRTKTLSDEQLAALLIEDGIDVVIDPLGFAFGSRILALARRPAPVQIAFPLMTSCGGDTIDYAVADRQILTEQEHPFFTEKIMWLPFALCYYPLTELPPIGPSPALASGRITFGSMNFLPKMNRRTFRLWGRVLDRVPGSRLLVKAGRSFRDPRLRDDFLVRLKEEGIDADRVIVKSWAPTQQDHLAVYNEFDIALDSVPYGGIITTFDAMSMGVPVVTRAGERLLDRYGMDILRTVGCDAGVSFSDDEYVERAVALAADPARLGEWRGSLRDRFLRSPACDVPGVLGGFEAGIRKAWREWCASGPA